MDDKKKRQNGKWTIKSTRKIFENPFFAVFEDDVEKPDFFQLTEENNLFLRVPGGNYTGIKALVSNSTLLVLSSFDLINSKKDDYRQPPHKWVDWDTLTQTK